MGFGFCGFGVCSCFVFVGCGLVVLMLALLLLGWIDWWVLIEIGVCGCCKGDLAKFGVSAGFLLPRVSGILLRLLLYFCFCLCVGLLAFRFGFVV